MIGLIGLLFLLVGIPLIGFLLSSVDEKIEEKDGGGCCACLTAIIFVLINILIAISMFKSCANNDKAPPSYDYYDDAR